VARIPDGQPAVSQPNLDRGRAAVVAVGHGVCHHFSNGRTGKFGNINPSNAGAIGSDFQVSSDKFDSLVDLLEQSATNLGAVLRRSPSGMGTNGGLGEWALGRKSKEQDTTDGQLVTARQVQMSDHRFRGFGFDKTPESSQSEKSTDSIWVEFSHSDAVSKAAFVARTLSKPIQ
jgi:hypothetical protein